MCCIFFKVHISSCKCIGICTVVISLLTIDCAAKTFNDGELYIVCEIKVL